MRATIAVTFEIISTKGTSRKRPSSINDSMSFKCTGTVAKRPSSISDADAVIRGSITSYYHPRKARIDRYFYSRAYAPTHRVTRVLVTPFLQARFISSAKHRHSVVPRAFFIIQLYDATHRRAYACARAHTHTRTRVLAMCDVTFPDHPTKVADVTARSFSKKENMQSFGLLPRGRARV